MAVGQITSTIKNLVAERRVSYFPPNGRVMALNEEITITGLLEDIISQSMDPARFKDYTDDLAGSPKISVTYSIDNLLGLDDGAAPPDGVTIDVVLGELTLIGTPLSTLDAIPGSAGTFKGQVLVTKADFTWNISPTPFTAPVDYPTFMLAGEFANNTKPVLTVQAADGQTGNIQNWALANGTIPSYVDNTGIINGSAENLTLAFPTGAVLFIDSSDNFAHDDTNLHYDSTNKYLGIGTNAPVATLTVKAASGQTDNIQNWTLANATTPSYVDSNGIINGSAENLTLAFPTGAVLFIDSSDNFANDDTNLHYDSTNKRLGVGTTTPLAPLSISFNTSTISATLGALRVTPTFDTPVQNQIGFESNVTSSSSSGTSNIFGGSFGATTSGSGTYSTIYGLIMASTIAASSSATFVIGGSFSAASTGTSVVGGIIGGSFGATVSSGTTVTSITGISSVVNLNETGVSSADGLSVTINSTDITPVKTIDNVIGVDIDINNSGNIFTNTYGIYIRPFLSSTFTNRWGIYQEGVSDLNFLAGNVGIGILPSLTYALDVDGDSRIDGKLTVTGIIDPTALVLSGASDPLYIDIPYGTAVGNAPVNTSRLSYDVTNQKLKISTNNTAAVFAVTTTSSSGILTVDLGGTGLSSGTSGGILGFTASGTIASSVALTANQIVLGGGAGATPIPLGSLGTTSQVLIGNASGAPSFGSVPDAALSSNVVLENIQNTFTERQVFDASGTGASSINIPNGVSPSSPVDGDFWYDAQKTFKGYIDGVSQSFIGCIFTQSANQFISNTVTETTMFGTGVGTLTLPASFFVVGKVIKLTLAGSYKVNNAGSNSLNIRVKLGGVDVVTTGATTLSNFTGASPPEEGFILTTFLTCQSVGAGGTIQGSGLFTHNDEDSVGTTFSWPLISTAPTVINTTISNIIAVTATFNNADVDNGIRTLAAVVEVLN